MKRLSWLIGAALLGTSTLGNADVWTGTADYTQLGAADIVGLFDTYDLGTGVSALYGVNTATAGDSFGGDFQSYVTSHELNSLGGGVANAPNLITNGNGTGYEITVTADFTQLVDSVDNGILMTSVTGGSATMYLDNTPDFSFANDSGFDDGQVLLEGNIVGGTGVYIGAVGIGSSTIDIQITSVNGQVFSPDAITDANSVFTLQITNPTTQALLDSVVSGANSVNGGPALTANDLLIGADGNIALATPLPAAVWMFIAAIGGLFGWRRFS
ncbi:MAG: flocculation-associated PEP-CTERM protein PepA [Pseudomonadota bacterium]